MNLGPHASFIIAAYVIAALVVIGLIVWVEIDNRAQRRTLAKLAAQGITRRSGNSCCKITCTYKACSKIKVRFRCYIVYYL